MRPLLIVYIRLKANRIIFAKYNRNKSMSQYNNRIQYMSLLIGHFDEEGNFIFDKKERVIQDAWLDSVFSMGQLAS